MKFNFIPLGGGQEIGANSYLMQINGKNIILDAGSHPKYVGFKALPKFELLRGRIDAIFITHAHFDHIGSLPIYASLYKKTNIYMTPKTFQISKRMLHNTVNVLEQKRKESPDDNSYRFLNFYNHNLLDSLYYFFNFITVPYDTPTIIENTDIEFTFFNAGHISGSAGVYFKTKNKTIFYTGDYKLSDQHLEKKAKFLEKAKNLDILITESTYITKDGKPYNLETEKLLQTIDTYLKEGKTILLPAFALGRTQELLQILYDGRDRFKTFNTVPIQVFGLGNAINSIYKGNFQLKTIKEWERKKDLKFVSDNKDLQKKEIAFCKKAGSQICIATNGMVMPDTYSFYIARDLLQTKESAIILSGYVMPNSPGNKLLEFNKKKLAKLFGIEEEKIQMSPKNVHQFHLSAHADDSELNHFIDMSKARNIIMVHGDRKNITKFLKQKKKENKNLLTLTNQKELLDENKVAPKILAPKNGELIYYDNRNKMLVSAREQKALIVTVGVSLLANFNKYTGKEIVDFTDREPILEYIKQVGIKSSAEIESLEKLRRKKSDLLNSKIYLIVSNTKPAIFVGKILTIVFRSLNYNVEIVKIEGLIPKAKEFTATGLNNFVNVVANIIEQHLGNAIINATGGYKAEISYATVLGILYKVPVYYLFDKFEEIVELPQMPLNFDFNYFSKYYETLENVLNTPDFIIAQKYFEQLPDVLQALFIVNTKLGKFYLNPNGVAFMRAYKHYGGDKTVK